MRLSPEDLALLKARHAHRETAPPPVRHYATRKEAAIQSAILEFLGTVPGVYAFKVGTGMFPMIYKGQRRLVRMGTAGISDLVGWQTTNGVARFLAVEVKTPGNYPSVEQQVFLARVSDAGGIAVCAHSVDDVRRALGR
jgi:hypothetical protein